MDFILGKIGGKTKSGGDKGKSKEDKIKKELEKELKKKEKTNQKAKSDQLRQMSGPGSQGQQMSTQLRPAAVESELLSSTSIPDSENGKYDVFEIIKVQVPQNKPLNMIIEFLDSNSSSSMWAVDGMLIDEELLYLEDEEADQIYQELKARSFRRKNMEEQENRLSMSMQKAEDDDTEEDSATQKKISQASSQSFEKIRSFLKKSNANDKLEFTQGLLNFANKIEKRFLIDGLLPSLELLANENQDIKKALLDQFIPLITYLREQCGQDGYDKTVKSIFPLLDNLLYDPKDLIKDKAISILIEIRNVVQQKENDFILNLTLKLAHDDSDANRVTSLKILNELAADMGQTLCESYIVPEIRSLGLDESSGVRQAVAKNLLNISKIVSLEYFTAHIFPLYDKLTQDKDEKVRKTCAEVVAEIAAVSPLEKKAQSLSDIYFRFLKDPTSKIVRGTAFQNIGPFIATLKGREVDNRIIDFYVSTTEGSSNKDVCYYSSYNFPAFVYTLGKDYWPQFKKVYLKLAKFNEARIKKTLSHSIHELASILGPEITEQDLIPIMERFLKDQLVEIKIGALKNLHIFLAEVQPEGRKDFIKYIIQSNQDSQYDWRTKLVLAQNLGKYAQLFDADTVYTQFLPMFFKFCYDPVCKVGDTACTSLANILEKFNDDIPKQESIVKVVNKNFFLAKTFKRRQLFVQMCGEAMMKKELFEKYFKADMLSMVNDKVSNVRMCLARGLRHHFLNQLSGAFVFDIEVNDAVRILKRDKHMDVRNFVEDIQTFPMNDSKEVELDEFLSRISNIQEVQKTTMIATESDELSVERLSIDELDSSRNFAINGSEVEDSDRSSQASCENDEEAKMMDQLKQDMEELVVLTSPERKQENDGESEEETLFQKIALVDKDKEVQEHAQNEQ